MTITQTVDIPANHRLTIDVPREVPVGRTYVIIQFPVLENTQANDVSQQKDKEQVNDETFGQILRDAYNAWKTPRTIEEALQMAEEKAADPNRKPISRLFGTHKGFFGGDGVAYQRAIRDEWD